MQQMTLTGDKAVVSDVKYQTNQPTNQPTNQTNKQTQIICIVFVAGKELKAVATYMTENTNHCWAL